jgi:hypothetical protein
MPSALCETGAQRLHGITLSAEELAALLAGADVFEREHPFAQRDQTASRQGA